MFILFYKKSNETTTVIFFCISGLSEDQYVPFMGCMRDVIIEGQPLNIENNMLYGDIHSHVCPTI